MLRKLPFLRSEFIINTAKLSSGTILAQVIPFLAAIILARLYTAEDFGLFAIYSSIFSLFAIVVTGRYELSIVLPKDEKDAWQLVILSLAITFIVSSLALLIVLFLSDLIIIWYHAPEIKTWLYIMPLSIFLAGIYQTLNYWNTRRKKFTHLSIAKISESGSTATSRIGLGYYNWGSDGLFIGILAGQIIAVAILLKDSLLKILKSIKNIKWIVLYEQGRQYGDFLKINTIHAFSDMLRLFLITFLLTEYYGTFVLGIYAFSMRILKTPAGFIGTSIYQVFYPKVSKMYVENNAIRPFLNKTVKTLFLIGFLPFFILGVWGEDIFTFIFSEEWKDAGYYAMILSPWLFFNFIISPISCLPIVLDKQKQFFIYSLIGHIIAVLIIYGGGKGGFDIEYTLIVFSGMLSLHTIFILIWIYNITKRK